MFLILIINSGLHGKEAKLIKIQKERDIRLTHSNILYLTLSSKKDVIAGVLSDNSITLWNMEGKPLYYVMPDKQIPSISTFCLSADGTRLAIAPKKGYVKILTISSDKRSSFLRWDDCITTMAFSPDGRLLIAGSLNGDLKLWNTTTYELIRWYTNQELFITSTCFSSSGDYVASASWDGAIRVWSTTTGKLINVLKEAGLSSPFYLLSGKDTQSSKKTQERDDNTVSCVIFSKDGKSIVCGLKSGSVIFWDVDSGRVLRKFVAIKNRITSLAFSIDGNLLACGAANGVIKILEPTGHLESDPVIGHEGAINFLSFRIDNTLISGSCDGTVSSWRILSGEK